jgi:protein ImuB
MLWACILLPQLALDAVLRRHTRPDAPLALVGGPAQLRSLHAVNAAAAQAGLAPGMRLTAAHALLGDFEMVDYQPQAEARVQRFLAAWAYRHSSLVSAQWPSAIVLEAAASFRLFGPWPQFERRLRGELEQLGFRHRIALAPTPRAARVLAGLRDGMTETESKALPALLDAVPVRRALLPGDAGTRLQRMGIATLGQLRALPADALRRRFGAALPEYLQRLYGQAEDHLEYYLPPEHFDERVELGYEVENHAALLFPLRRLIGDLCTYLSIRDGGVQRFVLRLEHEHGHTDVEVGLLAPERSAGMLFELARGRLERASLEQPVVALRLLAWHLPPFVPAMQDLFAQRSAQTLDWPQLRERLRARLGDEAVCRIAPAADPRPEKAWQRVLGDDQDIPAAPPRPPRPTWLLPAPVPLHDPRLRVLCGPERLESGWWDEGDVRRDYYVVETARGQRGWAFRPAGVREGGWMLQGWFG